ncbi:MAG: DUF928 domain-containing protein [Cyanobacteria bacterium P01_F01_bin.150]
MGQRIIEIYRKCSIHVGLRASIVHTLDQGYSQLLVPSSSMKPMKISGSLFTGPSSSLFARRCVLAFISCTILSAIPLSYPSAAQAGIFDFLFGSGRGGRSASGRRSGGAVRDECPVNTADGQLVDFASFQALAPENNRMVTTETHPTFWFNMPFAASEELKHVEFMLIHEDDKTYALDQPILLHLPEEPGVVRFQLPTTGKGLAVDRTYQWFFSIQCDSVELSRNPVLKGFIHRPSALTVGQRPWPEALLDFDGINRTSPDWQELEQATELTFFQD